MNAALLPFHPPKPHVDDYLVAPDGTRRRVLARQDHGSGMTSVLLNNPRHWVFNVAWYVKFHRLKIERTER